MLSKTETRFARTEVFGVFLDAESLLRVLVVWGLIAMVSASSSLDGRDTPERSSSSSWMCCVALRSSGARTALSRWWWKRKSQESGEGRRHSLVLCAQCKKHNRRKGRMERGKER
eukprot:3932609-Amphidinium_carterae.1